MKLHEMIEETNHLSRQMSPDNGIYFEKMTGYLRSGASSLTEIRREEILLGLARKIVKSEKKGMDASSLFGNDPEAYCKRLAEDIEMRRPRSLTEKIKYYAMIPWVALTWVFFIYMILGFFSKWFGGGLENAEINSSTLLIIAGLSIALIELVTRFLDSEPEQTEKSTYSKGIDLKAIGRYVVVAAALLAVGLFLGRIMPSFTVTPRDSLIIFIIGVVGQIFIFGRRSKV